MVATKKSGSIHHRITKTRKSQKKRKKRKKKKEEVEEEKREISLEPQSTDFHTSSMLSDALGHLIDFLN